MGIKNFRASDFQKGDTVVKIAASTKDRFAEPVPTSTPIDKDVDPNEVPTGTAPEIMTWVGEDLERAKKALELEEANEKPRKGLVKALAVILDAEDTKGED